MSLLTFVQLCCILSIFFHSVQCMVLVERWRGAYEPVEESSGTTLPVAPWAGFLPASSTIRETTSLPASTTTINIFQAAIPSSTTSSTLVAPPPQSTAVAMSNPSTITSVVTSLATLSATSTKTVRTTVMVSPTSAAPFANNFPSSTSEASSDAVHSTTPGSMSPTAQLGLGIGLTLFVIVSAGIAGLYFYRRRNASQATPQPPSTNMESTSPSPRNIFKHFFNFRRYRDTRDDAEWSIESVEKVSIVKNMRAQSVLTVSRSNSRRSVGSSETGTISIGMRGRAATMALNSHPMTPSYTAHATEKVDVKSPMPKKEVGELKAGSWPLE